MTDSVRWSNIYARYVNVLMLALYASAVPIPGDRHWLFFYSGISLLFGIGTHAYAKITGRLRNTSAFLVWTDLVTTWPAVAITGMVVSPFVPVLVLNILTMYSADHDIKVTRWFGVLTITELVGLSAWWWLNGRPGAGWDPAHYAVWTAVVLGIQIAAFAVAIVQVDYVMDPVVREMERQERELSEQRRRAELGAALSMITHEIRTPLTTITGYLGLAEQQVERTTDAGPRAAALGHLRSAAEATIHLDRLLESVLSYAREKRGRYAFEVHECRDVIERAIGFIRLKHGRAGQPFQIVVAPSPVSRIRCDRDAMHQVLVNLMENAVQHRHPDRALVLQLELAADGPGCRLTMQDNGRGMPPEVRDRLFGRFVSGREGGTGLGLAIVRQIMIDHGGEIELGETSDQGTMFVLRLPGEAFSLKEAGQGGQGRKG